MNEGKIGVSTLCLVSLAAGLCYFLFPSVALVAAQHQEVIQGGEIEYHRQCAVCHGLDGKGGGIMVPELVLKPADLTQIAKRNGGVFPFWRVYRIIDGRELARGHGSREMPVWGRRFQGETTHAGPLQETMVKGRILGLIFYLQSIQQ